VRLLHAGDHVSLCRVDAIGDPRESCRSPECDNENIDIMLATALHKSASA